MFYNFTPITLSDNLQTAQTFIQMICELVALNNHESKLYIKTDEGVRVILWNQMIAINFENCTVTYWWNFKRETAFMSTVAGRNNTLDNP